VLNRIFKNRAIGYAVYAVLLSAAVVLAVNIYWTLEDPRVLEVKNAKNTEEIDNGTVYSGLPIHPEKLHPGGAVTMHLNYCKLKDSPGKVTARLVGEKFTPQLTWPDDTTKAGCVDQPVVIPIPVTSSDDTYYVEFEVLYKVNPTKDRTVILRSAQFKVER
jgi:hypothetical protein